MCVCPFTLSNMNHLGEGKSALGFGPDQIRILVSMATDSSHRAIMRKSCEHSNSSILIGSYSILAGNTDSYKTLDRFKIQQDLTRVCKVSYP